MILSWKKDVDLTVLSSSQNYIDTRIISKGKSFLATFVYGEPDHTKGNAFWSTLSFLHPNPKGPWFLTGDFNELIDNSEKKGGPIRAEGTFLELFEPSSQRMICLILNTLVISSHGEVKEEIT